MTELRRKIRQEKMTQAYALMQEMDKDCWLFLSREGGDPAFSFLFGVHTIHVTALVLRKDGTCDVFCSASDCGNYVTDAIFTRVHQYAESFWQPFSDFLSTLTAHSLLLNISEHAHLADGLTMGLYESLMEYLPESLSQRIESSEPLLNTLRAVKTEQEQQLIEEAVKVTLQIYDVVFDSLRSGQTEREIGQIFIDEMAKRGVGNGIGAQTDPPIVCIVREGLAHRAPGDGVTKPGDVLVMDFSVRKNGYVSDIARTAYFLNPDEKIAPYDVQFAFDTAVEAVSSVLEIIKPGLTGVEVDAVGRGVVEAAGFPTIRHSVGHQVGSECHDGGTILGPRRSTPRPEVEGVLRMGEVYAIEPTVIQDDGLPSIIVEENVVLTENGCRLLSERQMSLVLIPCEGTR